MWDAGGCTAPLRCAVDAAASRARSAAHPDAAATEAKNPRSHACTATARSSAPARLLYYGRCALGRCLHVRVSESPHRASADYPHAGAPPVSSGVSLTVGWPLTSDTAQPDPAYL